MTPPAATRVYKGPRPQSLTTTANLLTLTGSFRYNTRELDSDEMTRRLRENGFSSARLESVLQQDGTASALHAAGPVLHRLDRLRLRGNRTVVHQVSVLLCLRLSVIAAF